MATLAVGGVSAHTPRWFHVAVVALAPIGCTVLYLFDPSDSGPYPLCPFRAMTGLFCPGCGTLRASNRMLHGRFGDAIGLNVMAVLLLPLAIYAYASSVLLVTRGRPLPRFVIPAAGLWALGAALVVFGVLRNIPVYPLTLLAP